LYTEIVVWNPVGLGGSAFGHVSTNVNNQNFSWGPQGWDTKYPNANDYNNRQQEFRGGRGVILNLTKKQEADFTACMQKSRGAYSATSNNCGTPPQECLKSVGVDIGNSTLPNVILDNLRDSPNAVGNVSYPDPRGPPTPFGNSVWQ
jgi:hypothetical protein